MSTELIDLKALKEAADFERVLAHYGITLKGTGEQRTALCPFHAETRGSFKVNLRRKLFNCFGCKAHGNVLDFVMQKEQLNEPQAARKIAAICGLTLPARTERVRSGGPVKTDDDRPVGAHDRDRVEQAAGHPRRGPKMTADTRKAPEVSEPSLEAETSVSAHPGAPGAVPACRSGRSQGESGVAAKAPKVAPTTAPDSPPDGPINPLLPFRLDLDPSHPYLAERAVSPEIIAKFGLGGARRGSMQGRVCIPLENERGELVGYAGRWPGEPPNDEERYRLPANLKKSYLVFNLNRVAGCRHLVLVEGFFSVFRLHALRVPSVALMGTVLSAEQEALLAGSGLRAITLMMDGDEPGRAAAAEILPRLAGWCFVRRADLPDGAEPDTVGEATLRALVGRTKER